MSYLKSDQAICSLCIQYTTLKRFPAPMFKFLDMPNWPLICALWIYKDLNLTPTSHQHLRGMKIHSSDNSTNFSFAIYLVIWKGRKLKEKMKGGRRKWKSYWRGALISSSLLSFSLRSIGYEQSFKNLDPNRYNDS